MPISLSTTIAGDSSSARFDISSNEGSDKLTTTLTVQDGARLLIITATGGGPDGHRRGSKGVRVMLQDPAGKSYSESFTEGSKGERVLLLPSPKAGQWTITVMSEGSASGEINAGVFGRNWRENLLRGGRWFSCTTCKLLIKSLVIAIVAQISAVAASGAAITLSVTALLGSGSEANELLKFLSEYVNDPIDQLLRRACSFLKLCGD